MDSQYKNLQYKAPRIEHAFGDGVHILSDPTLLLGLSYLSSPECKQPMIHSWVSRLYRQLLHVVMNECFPRSAQSRATRMQGEHPDEAVFSASMPDPSTPVVVVNVARAGTVPSFVCYDELNHFLQPDNVRQDHMIMNRNTDANQRITGSALYGAKIGGTIENAIVLVPDPMGATGSTLIAAQEAYKDRGRAKRWIAMNLIVTPEYVRRLRQDAPDIEIYALRLDRGLSTPAALSMLPGSAAAGEERGLNAKGYVIPGAGGLGEILNNAFV